MGPWDLPLESRVVETWEAVALEYSKQALCVEMHHSVQQHRYSDIYHGIAREDATIRRGCVYVHF
jgi:hypothetical protein